MKIITMFLGIALLFAVSVSFAGDKITIEDIYGTWVNADYNEKGQMAIVVINHDGTLLGYDKETSTEYYFKNDFTITDNWHDPEGNLWIKHIWVNNEENESGYALHKLSNSGKVKETIWSQIDYPDEISPIAGTYEIHYRQ